MRSPLLRGEELDDREKSTQEAVELRQAGFDALVELTTIGLGRDPQRATHCARYRHAPRGALPAGALGARDRA